MKKAVFLDRDGIVNELIFDPEHGVIDSPMVSPQVKLIYGIDQLLREVKQLGFTTIVCSNQPGIGLGKITQEKLKDITSEIDTQLKSMEQPIADYRANNNGPRVLEYIIRLNQAIMQSQKACSRYLDAQQELERTRFFEQEESERAHLSELPKSEFDK